MIAYCEPRRGPVLRVIRLQAGKLLSHLFPGWLPMPLQDAPADIDHFSRPLKSGCEDQQ